MEKSNTINFMISFHSVLLLENKNKSKPPSLKLLFLYIPLSTFSFPVQEKNLYTHMQIRLREYKQENVFSYTHAY